MKCRLAWMELDADALRHNLARARAAAPGTRVMACIKAAGYGHGLIFTAEALAPTADAFAVACTAEGIALRRAGFDAHPICILNGPADSEELTAAAEWRLEPVIHQRWQLEAIAEHPGPGRIRPWLKINSGMGRIGIPAHEAHAWHERLRTAPVVRRPVGVMTHMACADDRADDYTDRQWQVFAAATHGLEGPRSAANSASVLAWPDTHGEWVRPGIMLYGCSPFIEGADPALDLRPVMTLRAPLIAINHLERGDAVGYGRTWSAPEAMPVGVVAIGYGDGYPRAVNNGTPVLVGEHRAPIVGRVSMDKITIDLRHAEAAVGDTVTLWGRGLPIEEIAEAADTIGYELLCGVHGRVPVAGGHRP